MSHRQSSLQARAACRSRALAHAAVWLVASGLSVGALAQLAPAAAPDTLVAALTPNGLQAAMTASGAVNGQGFAAY